MATKPLIALARWADAVGANVENPPSGSRDTGFVASTPALSRFVNALLNQAYAWFQYLNDGSLSGPHTFDDSLEVAGAVTMQDELAVDGVTTLGSSLEVAGAATVGGALSVEGGLAVGEDLTVTGDIKHGDSVLAMAGPQASVASTNYIFGVSPVRIVSFGGAAEFYFVLPLKTGDRIKSVTFARNGNGAANITSAEVWKTTAAGADASLGSASVSAPGATFADTTINVADTTLAAGETVTLIIVTSAAGIGIANVRVTYDRP